MGQLAGVGIYVRDWPAAVRWYQDVLGLALGPYEKNDQFCMFVGGNGFLAVTSDHPEYSQAEGENRVAPTIQVDELDAELARLRDLGVKIDDRIDGGHEGYRLARIWDP